MAEYIKRIDVERNLFKIPVKVDEDGYSWILLRNAFSACSESPSADVVERKRGAWLRNRFGDTECGVCGLTLESFIEGVFYNYCPNCGADMRGAE